MIEWKKDHADYIISNICVVLFDQKKGVVLVVYMYKIYIYRLSTL